jgi:cytochrome bd-type quinol oxidase subunit 2
MLILPRILILIMFLVGPIILQIFLSKRENKWLGLILPIVNVIFSIIFYLNMAVLREQSITEKIMQFIMVFLISNIPTIIFIAIYLACREKFKKKKEIERMNIHDLE